MNPQVSIVTPVYKVESYIAECVQSVIDQDYDNIEFILVDDCGGDNSIHIAEELLTGSTKSGFSYKILRHEYNRGVSAARNTAMHAATGDYIFCLDSDDRLMAECISKLAKKAVNDDADIVMCGHQSEAEALNRGGFMNAPISIIEGRNSILNALCDQWFNVAPWCKLLKRSFILQNKLFFLEGIINEDNLWTFQLCLAAHKISFLKEDLYFYRYNKSSIMSDSKQLVILNSNKIILQNFLNEIIHIASLWNNISIYKIYMRQLILYYTMLIKYGRTDDLQKFARELGKYKYCSEYFSFWKLEVATYYRMWNIAFLLPSFLRIFYIKAIVCAQEKVTS
ncbi:glycosyltransferase family 2 protein [Bacteroides xylanisolvens]|uniref:glycosyltransferase family 2 protein n=1 Tax=Bacteroides xylanisolvens TaxID=371601 RepID=UPI0039B61E70